MRENAIVGGIFFGAEREYASEEAEGVADGAGGRVGAEVAGAVFLDAADGEDARKVFFGDFDEEIVFVVAQDDVVGRLVGADEVGFQDEAFGFGVGADSFEVSDSLDHLLLGGFELSAGLEI